MFRVFQRFHTYVASVSSVYFKTRSGVASSVLDACFMCFICLQTYVVSIVSGCFKSRSNVASLSLLFCCLTFALVSPPPFGASWARPLLDADVTTCCSHMLQLLAVRMRVRSRGGVSRDSPHAVGWRGWRKPRVGGRGM